MPETSFKPLKVALGLSGGVDSAVCAKLLMEAGHDVSAVFIECWNEPGCRAETDRQDALKVALQLDLPFQVLDFKTTYKEQVMGYFLREYKAGRTPNPDVLCNREIKFGLFYQWALKHGYDAIATGHYAQIIDGELYASTDAHKDQTYFLHQVKAKQLQHVLFPLGSLTKAEVRQLAHDYRLPVAKKPDSVGICFVGEINVPAFLRENLGVNPGTIVDGAGRALGKHDGLWFYTIGQRHGFTIDTKAFFAGRPEVNLDKQQLPPLFVIAKHPETNTLVVGLHQEQLRHEFVLAECSWLHDSLEVNTAAEYVVRIRHTGQLHPCTIEKLATDSVKITCPEKLSGLSEGQFGVIYQKQPVGWQCLGGGVITL